ncbi:hypothetical protein NOM68_16415 [Proteus mirabilis]|uniref:secretion/conjugation apparatus DotM-related subunit n=3 Tax=Proteus mirabilis TaxID=584 RepID=UPI00214FD00A|nr:hypothetical protein [Proteus mirabilis]MCS6723149.1 hypothetical protein [Proteus mirabilis]MCS6727793.1 hypothetical protein [Proteus mirabilis]
MKAIPTDKLIMLFFFLAILLSVLFWISLRDYIINAYTFVTYHFYNIFPSSKFIVSTKEMLVSANRNASNVSFSDFLFILNKTAYPYAILFSVTSIFIVFKIRKSINYKYNRNLNVNELAKLIVKKNPSIAHILAKYSEIPEQLLNHDDTESLSPLTPVEFAKKYDLINKKNNAFRKSKARKIFRQQINFESKINGHIDLKSYEKPLATVFSLALFFNDYDNVRNILNKLNLSCFETDDAYPNFELVKDECETILSTKEYLDFTKKYRSSRTMLYALLDNDLGIPPSHFRWLKGLDRTLWMALTSVGRAKKFVEGAGVIAYSITETWLANNEKYKSLNLSPTVRPATIGLETELLKEGLVEKRKHYLAKGAFKYINEIETLRYGEKNNEDSYSPNTDEKENKIETSNFPPLF